MQENNKPGEDYYSEEPLSIIPKIKMLCKNLSRKREQFSAMNEIFTDRATLQQRQMLMSQCEKLAKSPQFRHDALETIWRHCIYEPIGFYKSFEDLDEDDQAMLKSFISKSVSDISKLLSQFSNMQFLLLLYLGDLYRYAYNLCGEDQRDFDVAEQCYKKAILADLNNGRPYNQLALLTNEKEAAFFLFLRSLVQRKESTQALKNIKMMDVSQFGGEQFSAFYNLAMVAMFDFNRISFENARKEFDKTVEEHKESLQFIKLVQMSSMVARYAFRNDCRDEQFLYMASFLFQKMGFIIEEARKKINECEEMEQMNKRRNRRDDTDSASDIDTEDEEEASSDRENAGQSSDGLGMGVWTSAIIVAELLNICGEHILTRKLSVSLKLQFQNLLKTFVDLLNDLLAYISHLMATSSTIPKAAFLDWSLGRFFTNEPVNEKPLAPLLVHYIQNIIAERKVGIVFDKYFKLSNTDAEKEKQTVENLSKLHLTHINELNKRTSRIPVYIAPDHLVFLNRLPLMKKLLTSSQQTIIVARSVLGKLDKIKRENANSREAIRWIENTVSTGRVRMLQHTGKTFCGECLNFLEEKKLLDKQTLFISILTTGEEGKEFEKAQEGELANYPAICIENINSFIDRIATAPT